MPEPRTIGTPLYADPTPEDHAGPSDITGVVLKDLREAPAIAGAEIPPSFTNSQELSSARNMDEGPAGPPSPDAQRVATDDLGTRGQPPRRRSAQERIAGLVRQNHKQADENQELRTMIGRLNDQVNQLLNQPRAAAPQPSSLIQTAPNLAADPLAGLLGSGVASASSAPLAPAAAPPAQPALSALDVARIVDSAIEARDQRQRADQARAASFFSEQEASFQRAAEELPALRDGRTQARQLFNQLFNASPLRQLPNGPEHVAMQVRGLLADEAPRQPAAPQARQAVNIATIPAASPVDFSGAERGGLERELAAAYDQMKSGDTSAALHKKINIIKMRLRDTQR